AAAHPARQRLARHLTTGERPDEGHTADGRSGRADQDRPGRSQAPARGEGPATHPGNVRRSARGVRRSAAPATGRAQPRVQCDQVLPEPGQHQRASDARGGPRALADHRHGDWNPQGEPAPPVREVLPGRQRGGAGDRRHGPWPLSGPADRRADRRPRRLGIGRRAGRDLLFHGAERPAVCARRAARLALTRLDSHALGAAAISFGVVDGLALKLVLTPTLIGAVSMAGRRWGPGVSGWLVGFPLTSGPVAFFLALDQGVSFAAGAAGGGPSWGAPPAARCGLSGRRARAPRWPAALFAGSLGFAGATVVLQHLTLTLVPRLALVVGTILVALVFMPWDSAGPRPARGPRWDIPARLVVTTAIVLLLTGLATALGPSLTGLLSTFPLYGAILAGFAHHLEGPGPAIRVL